MTTSGDTTRQPDASGPAPIVAPLLAAAHGGPALAVSVVAALLAVSGDLTPVRSVTTTGAVLCGQLTIGWGNDLLDVARDRTVGRVDKPLATGQLSVALVRACLVGAAVAGVLLAAVGGWRSGVVLVFGVVLGHAYNLGLKATIWSWAPYALTFATLPAAVRLAGPGQHWPPSWMLATGAALGVGAHLVNALPDLADDERTGVRGLPHRLGQRGSRLAAAVLLALASVSAALGPAGAPSSWSVLALVAVAALVVIATTTRGRLPFQAAVAIALIDVVLLVAAR